jgi:hypothetical protein
MSNFSVSYAKRAIDSLTYGLASDAYREMKS